MIKDIVRLNSLYDYYGKLLTDNQNKSFYYYYRLDYTLSEIAEEIGISKQGVSENLKRAVKELERFEENLLLNNKSNRIKELINVIREKCDNDDIIILLDEIVEELDA
ncbi:MAG: hypothetical protein GXY89_02725 [Tissierellia bacterium]|nr:hypothetical protein [Tissierellia bacterium]